MSRCHKHFKSPLQTQVSESQGAWIQDYPKQASPRVSEDKADLCFRHLPTSCSHTRPLKVSVAALGDHS